MTASIRRLCRLMLVLGLVPALGPACDQRVSQCNELIGRLNPHTEAMARAVEGLARVESEPGRVDTLQGAIEQADRELAVLQLEDPRLAGFALRYRRQLMDARQAAQAMRGAAASKDPAGLHAAAQQADAFLEGQAELLEELNEYCVGSGSAPAADG